MGINLVAYSRAIWLLLRGISPAASKRFSNPRSERLSGARVSIGHVYYDYKPANLLFEHGQLAVVDLPDVSRQGVVLWDFSCFRSSMRRHVCGFSLRRPFDRRRAMIKEAIAIFQRGYLATFDKLFLSPLCSQRQQRFSNCSARPCH